MRFGIFGDVHANLEGLDAVLAALASERIDRYICMGDVVGYGADPNACCDRVRELDAICLFGNHDQACLGQIDLEWFNDAARAAVQWTMAELDPDHCAWLGTLGPELRLDGFHLVHSSLPQPLQWRYVSRPAVAADTLLATDRDLVFVGHTHVVEVYLDAGDGFVQHYPLSQGGQVRIDGLRRFVINPGSCGQPRDENLAAAYAVYDTDLATVELRRVPYDVAGAAHKILAAGLPDSLANRLFVGR